jgi:ferredoxin
MLIGLGRSIPELTHGQLNDVSQLVHKQDSDEVSEWVATIFLKEAVHTMFEQHATTLTKINGSIETYKVFDAKAIASWMSTSLRPSATHKSVYSKYIDTTESTIIGPHDRRIIETIAKYGTYGCNYLTEDELVKLYVTTIVGTTKSNKNTPTIDSVEVLQTVQNQEIVNVWRDIRNHNIISPVELQHKIDLAQLYDDIGVSPPSQSSSPTLVSSSSATTDSSTMLDECELIYENDIEIHHHQTSRTSDKQGRSSHELVQVITGTTSNDENQRVATPIPLYIKDGTFVFIDEETCIGCMQCVTVAPSSFKIVTDTGRARTYQQRSNVPDVVAAVQSCPVTDCMHYVSYDELIELEYIRDNGFNSDSTSTTNDQSLQPTNDHRHFGHSETRGYIPRVPLHVSRRDSDANHKSSFYQYVYQIKTRKHIFFQIDDIMISCIGKNCKNKLLT